MWQSFVVRSAPILVVSANAAGKGEEDEEENGTMSKAPKENGETVRDGTDGDGAPAAKEGRTPDGRDPAGEEIGGPKGPEPTRYGDWERKGRCIDF